MTTGKPTVLLVDDNRDDEELTIRGFRRANLQSTIDVAPRRPSRDRRFSTPTKFVGYTGLCPRVSYLFATLCLSSTASRTRTEGLLVLGI